jgi:site-specific DNA recombinase
MITAQSKTKHIKSDNSLKTYTYYHCTKRKVNVPCSLKGAIKEEELNEQIERQIASLTILPEFKQWALDCLNENNDQEIDNRSKIYESQHKTLTETQAQLDSLTKMRYRELIDDKTFLREKQILTNQITQLTSQLGETEGRAEKWLELTEKTFDFACYAHSRFLTGDLRTKKEILSALGSNFVLKDGKLTISLHKYFEPIIQQYPTIEKEYKRLELNKTIGNKAKTAALTTVFTRWQGL